MQLAINEIVISLYSEPSFIFQKKTKIRAIACPRRAAHFSSLGAVPSPTSDYALMRAAPVDTVWNLDPPQYMKMYMKIS